VGRMRAIQLRQWIRALRAAGRWFTSSPDSGFDAGTPECGNPRRGSSARLGEFAGCGTPDAGKADAGTGVGRRLQPFRGELCAGRVRWLQLRRPRSDLQRGRLRVFWEGGVFEPVETSCGDGHDNDCNGLIDCADPNCLSLACAANGRICATNSCVCSGNGGISQAQETACNDGHDNDCNGLTDCADPSCGGACLRCERLGLRRRARAPAGQRGNAASHGDDLQRRARQRLQRPDRLRRPELQRKILRGAGLTCSGTQCKCSGNGGLAQTTESLCGDGHDNDCDGLTDCADPNCAYQSCSRRESLRQQRVHLCTGRRGPGDRVHLLRRESTTTATGSSTAPTPIAAPRPTITSLIRSAV